MSKIKKHVLIIKSSFWFAISSALSLLVSFLQAFFLAKFLDRQNYGVYSLILLIVTMFDSFSEFGVKDVLIKNVKNNDDRLYTAFWMEFTRNMICFLLLIISSGYLASSYNIRDLKILIIIISFKFVFNGLKNINMFKLYTSFQTKKLVMIQQIPSIISGLLSIIIAYRTKNIEFICFSILFGDFLSLILSYMINPKLPKFKFKLLELKGMFKFCMNLFLLTTLSYLLRQIDYLFISKFCGVITLGLYTLAYKITNFIVTNVSYVINNVGFPLYSQIDESKKKNYFGLFNEIVIYIYILFSFIVVFYIDKIIHFVYGNKWSGLYQITCALLLFAFLRTISSLQGSIYKANNKPQIDNKLCISELIIILITIYPLFKIWSLYGIIVSLTLAILIRFLLSISIIGNLIGFSYIKHIKHKNNFMLILFSLIVNSLIFLAKINNIFIMILFILLYVILYLIVLFFISRNHIKKLLRKG